MKPTEFLTEAGKDTLHRYGLTEIFTKGPDIAISHSGNMSNTEQDSIKPNVDHMLGKGRSISFAHMARSSRTNTVTSIQTRVIHTSCLCLKMFTKIGCGRKNKSGKK